MLLLVAFFVTSCSSIPKYMSKEEYKALGDGVYAHMETSKGNMLIKLHEKEAPMTVANFVGLAEGKIENKAKPLGEPYYDGIIFHRVIKDFMIQGGDPTGTGSGDPGYKFEDEVTKELKHDKKGILSMANSGPNTNGSQFFITEVATPWLDMKHTVFGEVIDGIEVIDTIANVKKGPQDKPLENITINHIDVIRKGDDYKKYEPAEAFETAKANHKVKMEEEKKRQAEWEKQQVDRLKDLESNATVTESGLKYYITEKGDGAKPTKGEDIKVHYALRLKDGKVLDSSYDRKQPLDVTVGETQLIPGWMEALTMFEKGTKVFLAIPPALGYGAQGAGGVIPPNATLYFDMEVLK